MCSRRSPRALADSDQGRSKHQPGEGFGTRMTNALVAQLAGEITYADNSPGLCVVLSAPIAETS